MDLLVRTLGKIVLLAALVCPGRLLPAEHPPLALHPDNPHYFLFRGAPTVVIGSGEHYGAVLNLDFNYAKYLDELHEHRLNHSRLFSGAYVEPQGAFHIARNTLAPAEGRFLAPWARSDQPGYAGGGSTFDLLRWSDEYFARLRDFVARAAERDIIIEINLFCPFYGDEQWQLSPQNARNNVNGIGSVPRTDVYTLDKHGGLLAVHEALTRKIVTELRDFDNVYYEVCNEPYFGGVTMEWQRHIADVIVATEETLQTSHLISLNVANGSQKVVAPHPAISLFNFHYASPPTAVADNFGLDRPIGDNETGFKGTDDTHYRMEAWEFLLAGGALFSHLDYSFAVGHEDGTFAYPPTQPGGGNRGYRRQLRVLGEFMRDLDFVRMRPDTATVEAVEPRENRITMLSEPGRQYAWYLFGNGATEVTLALPQGDYALLWIQPVSGQTIREQTLPHAGGRLKLTTPPLAPDVAGKLVRRQSR